MQSINNCIHPNTSIKPSFSVKYGQAPETPPGYGPYTFWYKSARVCLPVSRTSGPHMGWKWATWCPCVPDGNHMGYIWAMWAHMYQMETIWVTSGLCGPMCTRWKPYGCYIWAMYMGPCVPDGNHMGYIWAVYVCPRVPVRSHMGCIWDFCVHVNQLETIWVWYAYLYGAIASLELHNIPR